MLTVRGIYEDGQVKLLDEVPVATGQKVLITFIDDDEDLERMVSLNQAPQELKDYLADEREDLYQEYLKK